ncbi:MAG: hypothetical protein DME24_25095, partial [Verrucomicrobia bacterium]
RQYEVLPVNQLQRIRQPMSRGKPGFSMRTRIFKIGIKVAGVLGILLATIVVVSLLGHRPWSASGCRDTFGAGIEDDSASCQNQRD